MNVLTIMLEPMTENTDAVRVATIRANSLSGESGSDMVEGAG